MSTEFQVIHIQSKAPVKPSLGQGCNGCGVCCLAEPCPVGMMVSLRRKGACDALVWNSEENMYRCGALKQPRQVLERRLPKAVRGFARLFAPWLQWWAARWIGAGLGCDSSLQTPTSSTMVRHPHAFREPPNHD